MEIKHFTWKEIEAEYSATEAESKQHLDDWNSNVTQDYTMTVEYYPEEVLGNDPVVIMFVVDDWNKRFPTSAIEYSKNMCIILDTMEKQLWGFVDVIRK